MDVKRVFDKERIRKLNEIRVLKQNLINTDYLSHKHADKALTDEEYEPMRLQRQTWRDEINKLEAELNK